MDETLLKQIVEALIFASDQPLPEARIRSCIQEFDGQPLGTIIDELNEEYRASGRAFSIAKVAGGYQFTTRPVFAKWIKRLYHGRSKAKLTQASLEVLAIVAFRQPISRAEIDAVRGVHSGGVLKNLLERHLITIAGRASTVGRPLLYKTTDEFLRYFGINDITDLPKPKEIEELFGAGESTDEIVEALSQLEDQRSADSEEAPEDKAADKDGVAVGEEPQSESKPKDAIE
jgi:segregation and condensation protein B